MKLPIINAVLLNLLAHSANGRDDLTQKGYEYMGKGFTSGKYPALGRNEAGDGDLNLCVNTCENIYKERMVAIVVYELTKCYCNYGTKGGERFALDLRSGTNDHYTYQKIETADILGYKFIGRGYATSPQKTERVYPNEGNSFLNCRNKCESQYKEDLIGFFYEFIGDKSCYCVIGNEYPKTSNISIDRYHDSFRTYQREKKYVHTYTKNLIPEPTKVPTKKPTDLPSKKPTKVPTKKPTNLPSKKPTKVPTKKTTNLPSKKPTKVPTKTPTAMSAGAQGDPHFTTWNKKKFDFHGVCDLVMLSNENFENNLGMDIHIRTKKMNTWSYISVLAIRIGKSILEVIGKDGGSYIINGNVHQGNNDDLMMLSGYPIIYSKKNKKQQAFRLNLGNLEAIVIKTWNSFVSIHFENPKSEHFKDSTGLMGSFPDGVWLSRDNVIIFDDANTFGQEWQVMEVETKLFHQVQGPQQPLKKCEIPSNLDMRRLLGENTMTKQHAETACIGVDVSSMDLCIFDVMASRDESVAGAY